MKFLSSSTQARTASLLGFARTYPSRMAGNCIRLRVAALRKNQNEVPPQRHRPRVMNAQNRSICTVVAAVAALVFSSATLAQETQLAAAPKTQTAKSQPFDPHDLTGVWVRGKVPKGNAPLSGNRPPMTPWGLA